MRSKNSRLAVGGIITDQDMFDLQLLSVREVKAILGISEWTLYKLLSEGAFPSIKIKKRRLISRRAIKEYIDKEEEKSVASGNFSFYH